MKNLLINSTSSSPAVLFFVERGVLNFSGKSFSENAIEFYKKIEDSLDIFIAEHSHNSLLITCEFEYINTSSSKLLFNVLKKAAKNIENVSVVWGYEEDDEDMKEQGEVFEESLDIHFDYRVFALPREY